MCNLPVNLHDDAKMKVIAISEKGKLLKQKNSEVTCASGFLPELTSK
jgi:hypothetical protein